MNLAKLQMFDDEVRRDLTDEGAVSTETFYFHQDKWWSLGNRQEAPATVGAELAACLSTTVPYRAKKSKYSNFLLIDVQAVVRAKFNVVLSTGRRDAIQRVLNRSARNASNAYAVKYNPLTGLLARDALNDLIAEHLNKISPLSSDSDDEEAEGALPAGFCVLALDIDHFKQVNDSFGHSYGDIVLRAFAIRIERSAKNYADKVGSIVTVCSHVSGEEFFCIAWGNVENAVFEGLAAHLVQSVNSVPLPSAAELSLLSKDYDPTVVTVPETRYRNITCSIGGVLTGAPSSTVYKVTAERLLKQADLALYKSKGQGRNRVTFYSAILQSGGRVLEHDVDVGVVVIDVGEEIGVVKGQEFFVFHPKYTGLHPFVVDDGRSKKVLANYPRTPLCRITVFDVQRHVSFCRVSEVKFSNVSIPRDAHLEAIPLGALSILMRDTSFGLPISELGEEIQGIVESQNRISHEVPADSKISYAVVRIKNEAQVLEMFGPSRINRSLLSAFDGLRGLSNVVFLGQLEPTQLILEYEDFVDADMSRLDNVLAEVEMACGNRIKLVAGVCAGGRLQTRKFKLPALEAAKLSTRVQLARYAAADEALVGGRIEVFSAATAERILSKIRELREPYRGLADYQVFVRLGVESASLENNAGLLASSIGEHARAEAHYKRAIEINKNVAVYSLNAISIQYQQGHFDDACVTYEKMDKSVLERGYMRFSWGTFCLAMSLAMRALNATRKEHVEIALEWIAKAMRLDQKSSASSALQGVLEKLQHVQCVE